ncbi:hypothetical protein AMTRI_Chr01g131430 [Amborella trichopoda]
MAWGLGGSIDKPHKDVSDSILPKGPHIPPSVACCSAVVAANMPCVCKYVTKEVEALIDIQKVIFIAQSYKRPLPFGTKCGSECPQLL